MRVFFVILLVSLVGLPMVMQQRDALPPDDARRVIIMTPHNEQIRDEFARGFDRWHRERYGDAVNVIYNVPGGTSEIRTLLQAQFIADLERDDPLGGDADIVFGGGSYEHDQLKRGVTTVVDGVERSTTISIPIAFDGDWLTSVYGENAIGDGTLFDPDHYWFGTALSGFGIVYNRDVLHDLALDEPLTWTDMCHPALQGWVALVNPAQSGSVTTAFDAILKQRGWEDGWRILRRMGANARYFSGTSVKVPIDVSQGDAAMGLAIDFYGRFQSQAIVASIGDDRVGYIDPKGVSTIDPDPISILRGAPNRDIAERFVEFCLTPAGQSLWQYRASPDNDIGEGPTQFELRRLPIRRDVYDDPMYRERRIDDANPFDLAAPMRYPDRNIRAFIAVLFAGMAMEPHDELAAAWTAIIGHPAYPADDAGLVRAEDVDDPTLRAMIEAFDRMPTMRTPDGTERPLRTSEHLAELKAGWLRDGWRNEGLWPDEASPTDILRQEFSAFFRQQYGRVLQLRDET